MKTINRIFVARALLGLAILAAGMFLAVKVATARTTTTYVNPGDPITLTAYVQENVQYSGSTDPCATGGTVGSRMQDVAGYGSASDFHSGTQYSAPYERVGSSAPATCTNNGDVATTLWTATETMSVPSTEQPGDTMTFYLAVNATDLGSCQPDLSSVACTQVTIGPPPPVSTTTGTTPAPTTTTSPTTTTAPTTTSAAPPTTTVATVPTTTAPTTTEQTTTDPFAPFAVPITANPSGGSATTTQGIFAVH